MKLKYYGVRGSVPSPGHLTARYGGNTSCVRVDVGNETIIIDAGTGLRDLGQYLMQTEFAHGKGNVHLLLSHLHWDHIQGFPFFTPAYIPGNKINLYSGLNGAVKKAITEQQNTPFFPVKPLANLHFHEIKEGKPIKIGKAEVKCIRLNHPGGVSAYRITHNGKSVVYASDTEYVDGSYDKIVDFAKGATLLIHDAQYTPEEYLKKRHWGHSTYIDCTEIAKKAGVKSLHLFHHEPLHDDRTLDEIVDKARREFPQTSAAIEGNYVNFT